MAEEKPGSARVALAWGAHAVTALGAVAGFLALLAIVDHAWIEAFGWMFAAVAIDAVDGALARVFGVTEYTPHFDGALLDNIVDYFTYVVVPAFFVYEFGLVPESCALVASCMLLMSSAYQFCQGDAKTSDHFFTGFPSYWNLVALYLFLVGLSPWANLAVLGALAVAVFVPVKYVYPTRTEHFRTLTLVLGAVWACVLLFLLMTYPDHSTWLLYGSLLYVAYYMGVSLWQTMRRGVNRG